MNASPSSSASSAGALKILHVVPSVNAAIGGPAVSVTGLADALGAAGVDVSLAALDYAEHGPLAPTPAVRTAYVRPSPVTRALRGWSREFPRVLRELAAGGVDVVHNHGLWMAPGVEARRLAMQRAVPLVISPRGMLDRWSLRHNRLRKQLALALYERRNLASAAMFHATSDEEAAMLREFGCRQPIAVIANGIAIDSAPAARSRLEARFAALQGKRWLVFLGRLHAKKGIPLLLQAWSAIAAQRPDWQLVIAGPDLDGQRAQFEASVAADAALHGRVTFTGMLEGADKSAALAGAQLVVLPTYSENFGIVVVEALAAGVPVVTTTRAPWAALAQAECGWWVEPEPAPLRDALHAATGMAPVALAAMGERGRRLASRYGWPQIARQFVDAYTWLARGGARPDCVRLA